MKLPPHKAGLTIRHNQHLNYYQTAAAYIHDLQITNQMDDEDWPSKAEWQKAIDTNEIWELNWYPDTPIGSLAVYAATLEEVLRYANEISNG